MLNTRTGWIVALAACASLTACNRLETSAQDAVRDNLKDPDSAKFGEFYYNAELKRACLTTNAKNSMGGYTGDQQVRLKQEEAGWDWYSSVEETQDECKERWADNKEIPV